MDAFAPLETAMNSFIELLKTIESTEDAVVITASDQSNPLGLVSKALSEVDDATYRSLPLKAKSEMSVEVYVNFWDRKDMPSVSLINKRVNPLRRPKTNTKLGGFLGLCEEPTETIRYAPNKISVLG